MVACYRKAREGIRKKATASRLAASRAVIGWKAFKLKTVIWEQIVNNFPTDIKIFPGLEDQDLKRHVHEGIPFLYMDNSYFHRGARGTKFRLIRNAFHLTEILDRPRDRLEAFGVKVRPWRRTGRSVIIIPPSPYYVDIYSAQGWLSDTLDALEAATDRPIIIKRDKRVPFAPMLEDAWAVVTYGSVAGMEAAMAGVPVFAGPICCSIPISSGPLSMIEEPRYPDREAWLRSLAYATWDMSEVPKLNFKDYYYQCE